MQRIGIAAAVMLAFGLSTAAVKAEEFDFWALDDAGHAGAQAACQNWVVDAPETVIKAWVESFRTLCDAERANRAEQQARARQAATAQAQKAAAWDPIQQECQGEFVCTRTRRYAESIAWPIDMPTFAKMKDICNADSICIENAIDGMKKSGVR